MFKNLLKELKIPLIILIATFGLSLGTNVFQYFARQKMVDKVSVKDSEIITMNGELHKSTTLIQFWKGEFDSLEANPNIKYKWKTKVISYEDIGDYVHKDSLPDSVIYVPMLIFGTDTLNYTGDRAIRVDSMKSAEGDIFSFDIWQKIGITLYTDLNGDIWIEDSLKYLQIKNFDFDKVTMAMPEKDLKQLYLGIMPGGRLGDKKLSILFGGALILKEKYLIGLHADDKEVRTQFEYRFLEFLGW